MILFLSAGYSNHIDCSLVWFIFLMSKHPHVQHKLKKEISHCARLMQHVIFGDGGEKLNAGEYKQTDTILPKHIGVIIIFE